MCKKVIKNVCCIVSQRTTRIAGIPWQHHRRQNSVPYPILMLVFGKERKCQLEEEAAVLWTAQTLDLRVLLEERWAWTNRKQGCSADRTIKADPDSKAGGKLREHGVILTWVLLWNTKLRSCLYSIQICWLEYLPQVAGLPAAEGLECQGEDLSFVINYTGITLQLLKHDIDPWDWE